MTPRHKAGNRSEVLHVRLTPELRDRLRGLVEEDGASESELVRRLIADEVRRRQPKSKR